MFFAAARGWKVGGVVSSQDGRGSLSSEVNKHLYSASRIVSTNGEWVVWGPVVWDPRNPNHRVPSHQFTIPPVFLNIFFFLGKRLGFP